MTDHHEAPREPRVGVVVVNYGSHALVARNLAVLVGAPVTVVVVDNYSSAAERAACEDLCARSGWHLLAGPNVGFGEGVNAGVARLLEDGCDVVVTVNPDLTLPEGALERLAERVRQRPDRLVAPRIVTPQGNPWGRLGAIHLAEGRLYTHGDHPGSPRWLSGACLATSAELWRRLGGFAPGYFMYWEDVDLSYRVQLAGGELVLDEQLVLVHDAGGTQSTGSAKSSLFTYYNCRNRLLFAARNLDTGGQLAWLRTTPAELRRAIGRANVHSLGAKLRTLWPAGLGTAAGVCLLVGERLRARRSRR